MKPGEKLKSEPDKPPKPKPQPAPQRDDERDDPPPVDPGPPSP